jgi:leucine dehydrogenase
MSVAHWPKLLLDEGAQIVITDIDAARSEKIRQTKPGAVTVVSPDEIHKQDVDVYAPCALGACLNDTTIPDIKAQYIIGAANNQLATPEHGEKLHQAGKIYIPDFVANSGGVIAVAMEVQARRKGSDLKNSDITARVEKTVKASTTRVMEIAKEKDIPLSDAGMTLAGERLIQAKSNSSHTDDHESDRGCSVGR